MHKLFSFLVLRVWFRCCSEVKKRFEICKTAQDHRTCHVNSDLDWGMVCMPWLEIAGNFDSFQCRGDRSYCGCTKESQKFRD